MSIPFSRYPALALLCVGLAVTAACSAQSDADASQNVPKNPAGYANGNQYVTLDQPQRLSPEGKVEVAEVFSYGCIHCADFAPIVDKLRRSLPAGVVFKLVPAAFNDEWLPFAQAYYAAKQLNLVDRTHLELFQAKFGQHYPINSLDELADFYARHGADRAEFLRIAQSPAVMQKIKRDTDLIRHWQVDGTPTIVVDGKYKVSQVTSQQQLADIALWLAKRDLAASH